MTGLLDRYVLRETVQAWLVVTVVLLLILVTNQFATVVGDAAADKLPRDAIFRVMGLTSVQYLTILVPVGLFLAIMLALARLYHDSEMAAMMACGVGPTDLYRPVLLLAGGLAVVVGVLAIVVSPVAVREVKALAEEARRTATLGLLEPGRFISFNNGEAVLFAEAITPDDHLRRVFVQRRVGARTEIIIADEAWARTAPGSAARVLTFARGRRYEGVPGQPRFRVIEFAEHGIPYALQPRTAGVLPPEARSSVDLYRAGTADDLAELHWRIGVPLTLFVLAIIAVPLARTEPRKGRFSGLAPAVLLYVVYANLLAAGKGWLERGQLPAWAGLWWVHLVFLAVAGALLAGQQGWWARLRLRLRLRQP